MKHVMPREWVIVMEAHEEKRAAWGAATHFVLVNQVRFTQDESEETRHAKGDVDNLGGGSAPGSTGDFTGSWAGSAAN